MTTLIDITADDFQVTSLDEGHTLLVIDESWEDGPAGFRFRFRPGDIDGEHVPNPDPAERLNHEIVVTFDADLQPAVTYAPPGVDVRFTFDGQEAKR